MRFKYIRIRLRKIEIEKTIFINMKLENSKIRVKNIRAKLGNV